MPTRALADRIFDAGGLAVALLHGCEIAVDAPGVPSGTYLTDRDLLCAECDDPIDPPNGAPAKFLAYNRIYNDGLCPKCDPAS